MGSVRDRAGYGIFFEGFTNGAGDPLQAAVSALPWTQGVSIAGPGFNIANPYGASAPPFGGNTFVAPATVADPRRRKPPWSRVIWSRAILVLFLIFCGTSSQIYGVMIA
jgi:hypothetical protein